MKISWKQWGERIRSWLEKLKTRRPAGIALMPGQMSSVVAGKFNLPRIDWEKLYRKSFLYNSIAAVICGYFMADLLVASLTPWFPAAEAPRPRLTLPSDKRDFLAYSTAIMPPNRPNLFNEKGLVPNNDEGGGSPDGPPVRTQLSLNLLGVIVIRDEKKSVASVEDKGSNQVLAVRIGEPITRDTIVERITDTQVIFINQQTNRREFIELPQDQILATRRAAPVKPGSSGGVTRESDNRYSIERTALTKALGEDFSKILQDARCVPEFEGGKPAGFRCFQIQPGSVYQQLGLQENDVICGIDGESIDPAKAFTKLTALREASVRSISICIKRNGRISNMQYDIN